MVSRWSAYVDRRITDLRNGLGRDQWEGHWPSPATISAAWDWACKAFPDDAATPSVVPAEDGCVAFLWLKGGWRVEVEVDRMSRATAWLYRRAGKASENLDLADDASLGRLRSLLSEISRDVTHASWHAE